MQTNTLQALYVVYQKYIEEDRKDFLNSGKKWLDSVIYQDNLCEHATKYDFAKIPWDKWARQHICPLGCVLCDGWLHDGSGRQCSTCQLGECSHCFSDECPRCGCCMKPKDFLCKRHNRRMARELRPQLELSGLAVVLGQHQPSKVCDLNLSLSHSTRSLSSRTIIRTSVCDQLRRRECNFCPSIMCDECPYDNCSECGKILCESCIQEAHWFFESWTSGETLVNHTLCEDCTKEIF